MPKKEQIIEPIPDTLESVGNALMQPAPNKPKENSALTKYSALQPAPGTQYILDLDAEVQKEVNGIEMGVLENGIPYLTESGLARMCGIDRKVLNRLAIN